MAERHRFPGQQADEKVIVLERRHWFILLTWLTLPILLLIPLSLIAWGATHLFSLSGLRLAAFWLLAWSPSLVWMAWRILDWENDYYIVTNKRVIHLERIYFMFESRGEAHLDRVQDVTIEMTNPFANLLNFGNVTIETAGTEGAIHFQAISNPRHIQRLIFESAGLHGKEERPAPKPQYRLSAEGLWRMLYPLYPTEEEGMIIWRKHWWILRRDLILPLMTAFVLIILWVWASTSLGYPGWVDALFAFGLAGIAIWIALRVIDWHNDLYILTKDRVIDIEKRPFVFEHRREANLGMIQDVSYVQPSFTAKALNFGNVRLETAGELGEFTFDNVPRPREVQAKIFERLSEFRQKTQREAEERRRTEIISIVEDYLRQAEEANRG